MPVHVTGAPATWTRIRHQRNARDGQRVEAHAAGLNAVPNRIAEPIRARYLQAIADAFEISPHGPPTPKKQSWKWGNQRDHDAFNLATRFHIEHDQSCDSSTTPPSRRRTRPNGRYECARHDKIAGLFRSVTKAAAFCTIRSYIQTGNKHHQPSLDVLQRLYTKTAWPPWLSSYQRSYLNAAGSAQVGIDPGIVYGGDLAELVRVIVAFHAS